VWFLDKNDSMNVLLNFECGSKLRPVSSQYYPIEKRKELLRLLGIHGYPVTVLTNHMDLQELDQLLKSHSIFIGINSFPFRYAGYLLNRPAICLFSIDDYLNPDQVLEILHGLRFALS
jgi:hypothetical protein